jgi:hypothetical protein
MASFQQYKDQIMVGAITLLGSMIWMDVREMKDDMKNLLQQVASDKVRIDNLEREVFKTAYKVPVPPIDQRHLPLKHEMVAVLRDENLTPIDDETPN